MTEVAWAVRTSVGGVVTDFQAYTGHTEPTVYLETKDLDLGSSDQEKYIDTIIMDFSWPADTDMPSEVYVAWCLKDRMTDAEDWSDDVSVFGADPPIFDIRETARYIKLRLTDHFPVTIWQLGRVIFIGSPAGGRL
jgi:hypothetical protein